MFVERFIYLFPIVARHKQIMEHIPDGHFLYLTILDGLAMNVCTLTHPKFFTSGSPLGQDALNRV